jgi:hypothetical protein
MRAVAITEAVRTGRAGDEGNLSASSIVVIRSVVRLRRDTLLARIDQRLCDA